VGLPSGRPAREASKGGGSRGEKGGGPLKDHQEGMVTFLGRLANRGSLCLLSSQMRNRGKGCAPDRQIQEKYISRSDGI
jgi:hypothetical protein